MQNKRHNNIHIYNNYFDFDVAHKFIQTIVTVVMKFNKSIIKFINKSLARKNFFVHSLLRANYWYYKNEATALATISTVLCVFYAFFMEMRKIEIYRNKII